MKSTRLTPEQRDLLLSTYRDKGFVAAKPLAIRFGVAPRYIARLARYHGITDNYTRGKAALVRQPPADKRWAWAIERGSVTI